MSFKGGTWSFKNKGNELSRWNNFQIIVKPSESGGSDAVYWCSSPEQVHLAFEDFHRV